MKRWASADLKSDKGIVLSAVSQNGKALKWASTELRGDREIALEAVSQTWEAVVFTAQALKVETLSASYPQGAPKGRQQKGETEPRTHIFADFCRFSLIFGSLCKSRDLGVADFRRKPQIFAGNRRNPQIFAETGFSRLLSPFWRAPIPSRPVAK